MDNNSNAADRHLEMPRYFRDIPPMPPNVGFSLVLRQAFLPPPLHVEDPQPTGKQSPDPKSEPLELESGLL